MDADRDRFGPAQHSLTGFLFRPFWMFGSWMFGGNAIMFALHLPAHGSRA